MATIDFLLGDLPPSFHAIAVYTDRPTIEQIEERERME